MVEGICLLLCCYRLHWDGVLSLLWRILHLKHTHTLFACLDTLFQYISRLIIILPKAVYLSESLFRNCMLEHLVRDEGGRGSRIVQIPQIDFT